VEGYVESTASGLVAGINAARLALGQECLTFPRETAIGGLANHIATADPKHFQPMNANFGLMPPLENGPRKKKERYQALAQRALGSTRAFMLANGIAAPPSPDDS
jgi:methylenetetrahydrofolate--tRNA-(uracil-5-)-methyltransferase